MPTILDTLKKGTEYLERYGIDEARLSMEHLIAHVLKVERMQLYLDFDRPLEGPVLNRLREMTKRRSRGEPLQHLLGSVEFASLEFSVDQRALIPRPETEELVALVLERIKPAPGRVLDLGCGSGVIGLSLASKWESTDVLLSDISTEALDLARENAKQLGLETRVQFAQSNLCRDLDGPFDLIVANLPYIPDNERTELSEEVRRDPSLALYGGESGTEMIEAFLAAAPDRLFPQGNIALEFGIGQAEPLRRKAEDEGFEAVEIKADLNGIDRFLFAVKSA
ncbi:MAG: peptide chain release factor N(5)-glutamine methyltransferase [Verrucomicrobiota bacterium]